MKAYLYLFLIIYYSVIFNGIFLVGQSKFEKKIEFKKNYTTTPIALEKIDNGYLVLCETINGSNSYYTLFKTNNDGSILNAVSIGIGTESSICIKKFSGNSIIVTGVSQKYANTFPSSDLNILMVDTNLNIKWLKSIGGKYIDGGGNPNNIEVLGDNSIICTMPTNSFGVGYPPGNRSDIYIFQLDSLGNLIWSRTIGTYGGDVPMDLKMLPDSSILIVGMSQYNDTSTHNYPYIIRINKDKTLSYSIILYPIWGFLNQIVIHNNNIYVSGLREYYLSGYGCYRHSCILIEMDILCN